MEYQLFREFQNGNMNVALPIYNTIGCLRGRYRPQTRSVTTILATVNYTFGWSVPLLIEMPQQYPCVNAK